MSAEAQPAPEAQGAQEAAAPLVAVGIPSAGLGVDIVEIARMSAIVGRSPAFVRRVFTEAEQAYCQRHVKPAVHYATHFAAKEAMVKALGTGFSGGITFTDVEVGHDEKGRPLALLHGRAAEVAREQGVVELALSLSRTHDTAVANAIALTPANRPVQREKDPAGKQLAERFKELRGMLDELDVAPAQPAAQTGAQPDGGSHEQ